MKRVFLISFAILFLLSPLYAQKANFQLAEQYYMDELLKKAGSLEVTPVWIENSDKFWYKYKTRDGENYYLIDPLRKSKIQLFDSGLISSELTKHLNKPVNPKELPVKNLKFKDNKTITFNVDSLSFEYVLNSSEVMSLGVKEKEKDDQRWALKSPDKQWIVFAKEHNLYLMRTDDPDSTEIQLTTDGEKWYSYCADNGEESKKRVMSGASWFDDSKKLFTIKQDERKVNESYVINALSKPRPTVEIYKDAFPGEENVAQFELLIFDVESKNRVDVDVKKWQDQRLGGWYGNSTTNPGTGSDDLFFIRINRPWQDIELCKADTETGEVEVLISEHSEPYINVQYFNYSVINNDSEIIWFSERTGWGHYYLYDIDGNLKNAITEGAFTCGEIAKIDTTERTLYLQGFGKEQGRDPYDNYYYRTDFDDLRMNLLTPENGMHSFSAHKTAGYFIDTYSRVDSPPVAVVKDMRGNSLLELEKYDNSWLLEMGWKAPEPFIVKAADGITDLIGVMWRPFDFDPEKKYPIISYVYPGPQTEPVPRTFLDKGARYDNMSLSNVGFIVMAVGQRGGSPQRSKWYHNYGYKNLRDYGLADNKAAIEQLSARYPFIDINKVGIYGHSGGGFMSTAAMLVYPDFYKAAVSSAGNHDNNVYNYVWSELHHGVKEVTEKGKDDKEVTKWEGKVPTNQSLAKNLKGHLLLVHGDNDNNVNPANSIRVVDELIKAGKRFDLLLMPGKRHGYDEYVKYFEQRMWYYFAQHLLGDYRTNVDIKDYDK